MNTHAKADRMRAWRICFRRKRQSSAVRIMVRIYMAKNRAPNEWPAPWARLISCRNVLETIRGNIRPHTIPYPSEDPKAVFTVWTGMSLPWSVMVSLWIRIEMRLRIAHGAVVFKAMPILADDPYRSLRREGFELHIAPNRFLIRGNHAFTGIFQRF